jgi:hypothetical protein
VAKPDVANEVDVNRFVAETAMQMNDRLVELSSFIRGALEDAIPELRGDARSIELLGARVEGNVDTLLHALRHDIAVERVEGADCGAGVCPPTGTARRAGQCPRQGLSA